MVESMKEERMVNNNNNAETTALTTDRRRKENELKKVYIRIRKSRSKVKKHDWKKWYNKTRLRQCHFDRSERKKEKEKKVEK